MQQMSNDLNKKCLCLEIIKISNNSKKKTLFANPICNSKSDCHNHHWQIDESVHFIHGSCLCEGMFLMQQNTTNFTIMKTSFFKQNFYKAKCLVNSYDYLVHVQNNCILKCNFQYTLYL